MILLFASFFSSLLLILGIIRYKHLHEHFSGDHDLSGPQKFHQGSVPRIGGLGIYAALWIANRGAGRRFRMSSQSPMPPRTIAGARTEVIRR